jgi:hypothetical protein
MYGMPSGGIKKGLVTSTALALLAFAVLWLGFRELSPRPARDFEECVELAQANPPSTSDRGASTKDCSARFAGRRKAGGGYTYYDFMQDRHFDIAGPNPTAEEHKRIDHEYMAFLDAQRREAISADLAKRQNEKLRAELEGARKSVGPPMVLTPKSSPSSAEKRSVDRLKLTRCEDSSLTCSWAKLSAAVKNAFASSPRGEALIQR